MTTHSSRSGNSSFNNNSSSSSKQQGACRMKSWEEKTTKNAFGMEDLVLSCLVLSSLWALWGNNLLNSNIYHKILIRTAGVVFHGPPIGWALGR